MLHRIGMVLVSVGAASLLAVLAVLLTDGLRPGRVSGEFLAGTMAVAGAALMGGLRLLRREGDTLGF